MGAIDPHARALLAAVLYRATMRAFAASLATRGLPAPRPQEKMESHRVVEEAAWDAHEQALEAVRGRGVDDGLPDDAALRALVDTLVADALGRRSP